MIKRALTIQPETLNEDDRIIEFSCSSEEPYNRGDYVEILSHDPSAIRLNRLANKAAVLFNHKWDELIGVVEEVTIDTEMKKLRVKVKFSKTEEGLEALTNVQDGILTKVSIGYIPMKYIVEGETEEKTPIYRIIDWEPYEVSLVTVPADDTVGIGRMVEEQKTEINNQTERITTVETNIHDIQKQERERQLAIGDLARVYNTDLSRFVEDGSPVESVINHLRTSQPKQTPLEMVEVDLTPKEKQVYSLKRAYQSQLNPQKYGNSFEKEISDELAKKYGVEAQGIYVPYGILGRDLTSGGSGTGAELKGTDHLGNEFIDVLRNKMVTLQAGVRVLSGLKGNIDIPKLTAGATLYWATEVAAITESTPTTASVTMSPKKCGAYIEISKMLLAQSDPSAEAIFQNDLLQALALGWDAAILHGTGSPQPTGIAATSNIGSVTGTGLDYAAVLEFISDVETANANVDTMKFITNPAIKAILRGREKVTGYPDFLMGADGKLEGFDVLVTNQVSSGYMFFGDFSQALLGLWGGIDLVIDPYSKAEYGLSRFIATQMVDVAVRYPGAFSVATGVN